MVIKKPKKSTSTEGVKEKCVEKFIEWWPDDILLRQLISKIVPKKDTLRLFNINEITNIEKLAGILFDLVGHNFLSEVYGDRYKTSTKEFRFLCLDAAIKNEQVTEKEILDKSRQVGSRMHSYDTLENVAAATISSSHNYRWGLELTKFLDLPTSVVESAPKVKPGAKMETVEANLDIKPLHDYQIAGSQHIMRMLTEEDFTKKTLIAIPTGAGKTRLVVETLVDWLNNQKQDSPEQQKNSKFIIWLAHSHELCEQAIDAFKQIYHAKGKTALNIHRFFGAGGELPAGTEFEDLLPENGVIVATISSFYKILPKLKKKSSLDQVDDEKRNDDFQEFDENSPLEPLSKITSCIVIDEAHRSLAASYTAFLRAMGLSFRGKGRNDHNIVLVGLTATPFRGSGRDQFNDQELGAETKRLRKRYGGEPFVPFIHSHSSKPKPTAIIDCPDEMVQDDPVRINGDRSFDNEGIITNYDWSIELEGEEKEPLPNVKPEKTIYQNFPKEGKYWIKLKVTNSDGNFDEAKKEIHVIKVESEIPMDDFGKQKVLYKTLTDRNILCNVYSGTIKGVKKIIHGNELAETNLKGEIQKRTLGEIAEDYKRNNTILNTINNLHSKYNRKRILFFACNIDHARSIAIVLKAKYDIKATYLDSTIPIGRRIQIINQFKNGEITVLCNVDILTTGFDVPEIDCVFVARPAKSTVLFTQMIGRGMRGTRMGGTPDMWLINTNDQIQLGYYTDAIPLGWQTFEPMWKSLPSSLDLELLPVETKRSSDVTPETYDKWHAETVERPTPEPISEPVEETKPKVVEHTCLKCGTTATGIVEIRDVFGFEAPDRLVIEQLAMDEHGQIPKKCQKCRDAEREPKEIEVEVAQTPKQDEWIEYMSAQKSFKGNYQMVLGLYFVRCQRYQSGADLESARQFLAKHNPGRSAAFFYNHPVFDVYNKRNLITIDQTIQPERIDFKKMLDLNGFEQLCYEKLEELESEKSIPVPSTENLTDKQTKEKLDSHYESCKGIFGHIPTTRQFKESTRKEWLDLMERLYGSYDNFLDSKNESLETDQDLKDILYYEYYDLFYIKHGYVAKEDLHEHGKYRIDDYEDAFGSFDDFLQIVSNIDKRVMKLFEEPVPDSELEDFLEKLYEDRKVIREGYGRIPHFDEIRTESKIGVEHYIVHGIFQSATLQRFHDAIDAPSDFGRKYVKPRAWIWSVTPENWKILNEKGIWASKKPIEKISQKVSPGDKVIFYVIGTGEFQGIFEFDGKWYPAPSPVWDDETDDVIYQSQIKIKPLVLGHVQVYGIAPKLQVFPSYDKRLINLVLKGGSGYPSNGGQPISAEDYTKISKAAKSFYPTG